MEARKSLHFPVPGGPLKTGFRSDPKFTIPNTNGTSQTLPARARNCVAQPTNRTTPRTEAVQQMSYETFPIQQ
eukprot:6230312-Amphidinium_carterae.1